PDVQPLRPRVSVVLTLRCCRLRLPCKVLTRYWLHCKTWMHPVMIDNRKQRICIYTSPNRIKHWTPSLKIVLDISTSLITAIKYFVTWYYAFNHDNTPPLNVLTPVGYTNNYFLIS